MKLLILLVGLLSMSVWACDNHPGATHEQFVVSLRKRTQVTVPTSTYSTAITETIEETTTSAPEGETERPAANDRE